MSFLLFIALTFNAWSMMSPCDHSHATYEDEQHIECTAHQEHNKTTNQSKSGHANHSGCLKFCCHFMPINAQETADLLSSANIRLMKNEFFYILGHVKNHIDQILRPPIA
jgi:hypothetical protein